MRLLTRRDCVPTVYTECGEGDVRDSLQRHLAAYRETRRDDVDLIFFREAVTRAAAMSRVLVRREDSNGRRAGHHRRREDSNGRRAGPHRRREDSNGRRAGSHRRREGPNGRREGHNGMREEPNGRREGPNWRREEPNGRRGVLTGGGRGLTRGGRGITG